MNNISLKSDFLSLAPSPPARRFSAKSNPFAHALAPVRDWLQRGIDELDSHRSPPLQLEFSDRFVNFRSIKEFEFALSARIEFPAVRVSKLIAMTPVALEAQAGRIRDVEREFAKVLARAVHHPKLIGEYFRELDLKRFSQDHGWRETMESLMRLSPNFDSYKRIALVKYMQYLRARQNIMRSVFIEKTKYDENACVYATQYSDRHSSDDIQSMSYGDTARFDRSQGPIEIDELDDHFVTLAKGETLTLNLGSERQMDLILAGNRLRLYTGRECYMVDEGDNTHPLHAGKNLIGRHSVCDVVVDAACRAVSRNHLIVQRISDNEIQITDLSAHGTEVPARFLKHH